MFFSFSYFSSFYFVFHLVLLNCQITNSFPLTSYKNLPRFFLTLSFRKLIILVKAYVRQHSGNKCLWTDITLGTRSTKTTSNLIPNSSWHCGLSWCLSIPWKTNFSGGLKGSMDSLLRSALALLPSHHEAQITVMSLPHCYLASCTASTLFSSVPSSMGYLWTAAFLYVLHDPSQHNFLSISF